MKFILRLLRFGRPKRYKVYDVIIETTRKTVGTPQIGDLVRGCVLIGLPKGRVWPPNRHDAIEATDMAIGIDRGPYYEGYFEWWAAGARRER